MERYIKVFKPEERNKAYNFMVSKNRACMDANNTKDIYCLVSHPDGFAVVDLETAVDLGGGYEWSYR